jgi:hypothetical protein
MKSGVKKACRTVGFSGAVFFCYNIVGHYIDEVFTVSEICTSQIQDCRYETCSMFKETFVNETEA